ncbi:MAG: acetate/propionate family kinase [Pseudomonadota bacterium]
MQNSILVLNAGSSSIKFAVYPAAGADAPLVKGMIDRIGGAARFRATGANGLALEAGKLGKLEDGLGHADLTARLLAWLDEEGGDFATVAVGHRVVHGGRGFTDPVLLDAGVMAALEDLIPLAPLHQPHNLSAIKAVAERAPELRQVACFDTAFHRTQGRLAELFALPRALSEEGIIRYGFHGLSYDYIASVLPDYLGDKADGRVIVAHLGNGASLCAMKGRRSVDTTMGFTALDGLMMGSRCGAIDAGVVLHLLQEKAMSVAEVERLLYRESGLLGVSGLSNNMRELEESDRPDAREAVDLFCYRAAKQVCALLPTLEGLDALVFTAGIGENSANIRANICRHLSWMGVDLDGAKNQAKAAQISSLSSEIKVCVIPTDEELVIARAARRLVAG